MTSRKLYVLLFYWMCTANGATTSEEEHPSTPIVGDSPFFIKILQSVDEATNDEHLFNVTLRVLKSLCVCMRETLKGKEVKTLFTGDTNSLQIEDELQMPSKDVFQLYTKIYNTTCFNLRQDLLHKINIIHDIMIENDDEFIKNSTCGKKMEITTEKIIQMSKNTEPLVRDEEKSNLNDVLYKALIETKQYHKYAIKINNLFKRAKQQASKNLKRSVIIILTLYPTKDTNSTYNNSISGNELNVTLYSKSPIDIDIFETKYQHLENKRNGDLLSNSVSDCQLRSIFNFIIESEKNNFTRVFKLLRKKSTIKIYIDIITMWNHTDYSSICCGNKTDAICKFDESDSNVTSKEKQLPETVIEIQNKRLLETISKIKAYVKMYNHKINRTSTRKSTTKLSEENIKYLNSIKLPILAKYEATQNYKESLQEFFTTKRKSESLDLETNTENKGTRQITNLSTTADISEVSFTKGVILGQFIKPPDNRQMYTLNTSSEYKKYRENKTILRNSDLNHITTANSTTEVIASKDITINVLAVSKVSPDVKMYTHESLHPIGSIKDSVTENTLNFSAENTFKKNEKFYLNDNITSFEKLSSKADGISTNTENNKLKTENFTLLLNVHEKNQSVLSNVTNVESSEKVQFSKMIAMKNNLKTKTNKTYFHIETPHKPTISKNYNNTTHRLSSARYQTKKTTAKVNGHNGNILYSKPTGTSSIQDTSVFSEIRISVLPYENTRTPPISEVSFTKGVKLGQFIKPPDNRQVYTLNTTSEDKKYRENKTILRNGDLNHITTANSTTEVIAYKDITINVLAVSEVSPDVKMYTLESLQPIGSIKDPVTENTLNFTADNTFKKNETLNLNDNVISFEKLSSKADGFSTNTENNKLKTENFTLLLHVHEKNQSVSSNVTNVESPEKVQFSEIIAMKNNSKAKTNRTDFHIETPHKPTISKNYNNTTHRLSSARYQTKKTTEKVNGHYGNILYSKPTGTSSIQDTSVFPVIRISVLPYENTRTPPKLTVSKNYNATQKLHSARYQTSESTEKINGNVIYSKIADASKIQDKEYHVNALPIKYIYENRTQNINHSVQSVIYDQSYKIKGLQRLRTDPFVERSKHEKSESEDGSRPRNKIHVRPTSKEYISQIDDWQTNDDELYITPTSHFTNFIKSGPYQGETKGFITDTSNSVQNLYFISNYETTTRNSVVNILGRETNTKVTDLHVPANIRKRIIVESISKKKPTSATIAQLSNNTLFNNCTQNNINFLYTIDSSPIKQKTKRLALNRSKEQSESYNEKYASTKRMTGNTYSDRDSVYTKYPKNTKILSTDKERNIAESTLNAKPFRIFISTNIVLNVTQPTIDKNMKKNKPSFIESQILPVFTVGQDNNTILPEAYESIAYLNTDLVFTRETTPLTNNDVYNLTSKAINNLNYSASEAKLLLPRIVSPTRKEENLQKYIHIGTFNAFSNLETVNNTTSMDDLFLTEYYSPLQDKLSAPNPKTNLESLAILMTTDKYKNEITTEYSKQRYLNSKKLINQLKIQKIPYKTSSSITPNNDFTNRDTKIDFHSTFYNLEERKEKILSTTFNTNSDGEVSKNTLDKPRNASSNQVIGYFAKTKPKGNNIIGKTYTSDFITLGSTTSSKKFNYSNRVSSLEILERDRKKNITSNNKYLSLFLEPRHLQTQITKPLYKTTQKTTTKYKTDPEQKSYKMTKQHYTRLNESRSRESTLTESFDKYSMKNNSNLLSQTESDNKMQTRDMASENNNIYPLAALNSYLPYGRDVSNKTASYNAMTLSADPFLELIIQKIKTKLKNTPNDINKTVAFGLLNPTTSNVGRSIMLLTDQKFKKLTSSLPSNISTKMAFTSNNHNNLILNSSLFVLPKLENVQTVKSLLKENVAHKSFSKTTQFSQPSYILEKYYFISNNTTNDRKVDVTNKPLQSQTRHTNLYKEEIEKEKAIIMVSTSRPIQYFHNTHLVTDVMLKPTTDNELKTDDSFKSKSMTNDKKVDNTKKPLQYQTRHTTLTDPYEEEIKGEKTTNMVSIFRPIQYFPSTHRMTTVNFKSKSEYKPRITDKSFKFRSEPHDSKVHISNKALQSQTRHTTLSNPYEEEINREKSTNMVSTFRPFQYFPSTHRMKTVNFKPRTEYEPKTTNNFMLPNSDYNANRENIIVETQIIVPVATEKTDKHKQSHEILVHFNTKIYRKVLNNTANNHSNDSHVENTIPQSTFTYETEHANNTQEIRSYDNAESKININNEKVDSISNQITRQHLFLVHHNEGVDSNLVPKNKITKKASEKYNSTQMAFPGVGTRKVIDITIRPKVTGRMDILAEKDKILQNVQQIFKLENHIYINNHNETVIKPSVQQTTTNFLNKGIKVDLPLLSVTSTSTKKTVGTSKNHIKIDDEEALTSLPSETATPSSNNHFLYFLSSNAGVDGQNKYYIFDTAAITNKSTSIETVSKNIHKGIIPKKASNILETTRIFFAENSTRSTTTGTHVNSDQLIVTSKNHKKIDEEEDDEEALTSVPSETGTKSSNKHFLYFLSSNASVDEQNKDLIFDTTAFTNKSTSIETVEEGDEEMYTSLPSETATASSNNHILYFLSSNAGVGEKKKDYIFDTAAITNISTSIETVEKDDEVTHTSLPSETATASSNYHFLHFLSSNAGVDGQNKDYIFDTAAITNKSTSVETVSKKPRTDENNFNRLLSENASFKYTESVGKLIKDNFKEVTTQKPTSFYYHSFQIPYSTILYNTKNIKATKNHKYEKISRQMFTTLKLPKVTKEDFDNKFKVFNTLFAQSQNNLNTTKEPSKSNLHKNTDFGLLKRRYMDISLETVTYPSILSTSGGYSHETTEAHFTNMKTMLSTSHVNTSSIELIKWNNTNSPKLFFNESDSTFTSSVLDTTFDSKPSKEILTSYNTELNLNETITSQVYRNEYSTLPNTNAWFRNNFKPTFNSNLRQTLGKVHTTEAASKPNESKRETGKNTLHFLNNVILTMQDKITKDMSDKENVTVYQNLPTINQSIETWDVSTKHFSSKDLIESENEHQELKVTLKPNESTGKYVFSLLDNKDLINKQLDIKKIYEYASDNNNIVPEFLMLPNSSKETANTVFNIEKNLSAQRKASKNDNLFNDYSISNSKKKKLYHVKNIPSIQTKTINAYVDIYNKYNKSDSDAMNIFLKKPNSKNSVVEISNSFTKVQSKNANDQFYIMKGEITTSRFIEAPSKIYDKYFDLSNIINIEYNNKSKSLHTESSTALKLETKNKTVSNKPSSGSSINVDTQSRKTQYYVGNTYKLFKLSTASPVYHSLEHNETTTNRGKTVRYNTYEPTASEDLEIPTDLQARIDLFKKNLLLSNQQIYQAPVKIKTTESCALLRNLSLQINQALKSFIELVKAYNCSDGNITLARNNHGDYLKNKSRKANLITKNFVKIKNNSSSKKTLLDPFAKTNQYPVKINLPKNQKVVRTIQLAGKNKPIITMNTEEFFAHRRFITQRAPFINSINKRHPIVMHKPPSVSRYMMLRPKFEQIDQAASNFKSKSLKIENNDNFYRDSFETHRRAGLTWKDKVYFMQTILEKTPGNKLASNVESAIPRPGMPLLPQPRLLRDRVNFIRNYLIPPKYHRSTTTKYYVRPPPIAESDEVVEEPVTAFPLRRNNWVRVTERPKLMVKTTSQTPATSRRPKRTRPRRTIYFLSPTVPYNRYF